MAVAEAQALPRLIEADEPAAFEVIRGGPDRRLIIACDHASRTIPRSLGTLGLEERYLDDHIAWDIGAAEVARMLCRRLGGVAVLGNYSRLVIDLNRQLDDSTAIPAISDGVLIPGNLGPWGIATHATHPELFMPYHEALHGEIMSLTTADHAPAMVNIHSFTPRQHGLDRPWDAGVLWDADARLALPLIARLRSRGDLFIGDNEPYSGRHPADYTADHHAERLGLACAGVEIRQDLVADPGGQAAWADRLAQALDAVLADKELYRRAATGTGD